MHDGALNKTAIISLLILVIIPSVACGGGYLESEHHIDWAPWDFSVNTEHPESRAQPDVEGPGCALASSMLYLYKAFISPADGSRCPMHPSCSDFTHKAITSKGLIIGVVISCDRLMSCGCDLDKYRIVNINGVYRFDDPCH